MQIIHKKFNSTIKAQLFKPFIPAFYSSLLFKPFIPFEFEMTVLRCDEQKLNKKSLRLSNTILKHRFEVVGSKAADVKSRKRPMSMWPMLLEAADVCMIAADVRPKAADD